MIFFIMHVSTMRPAFQRLVSVRPVQEHLCSGCQAGVECGFAILCSGSLMKLLLYEKPPIMVVLFQRFLFVGRDGPVP